MLKADLRKATYAVEAILRTYPETRADDGELILHVYEQMRPGCTKETTDTLIHYRQAWGLPSFETIRRARQKLQAQHEDLRPGKITQTARRLNEAIYYDYARQ